ncbi:hypothetical protein M9Y10_042691 [Tritrichomonas musculus]|uniref:Uncharacterized protein n=1 Tax=Tritrichomonas musculus TaxID=1915356 RepID=A0ABR2JXJ8_9EUKA
MIAKKMRTQLSQWKRIKVIQKGQVKATYELNEKEQFQEKFKKSKPRNLQDEILKLKKSNSNGTTVIPNSTSQPQVENHLQYQSQNQTTSEFTTSYFSNSDQNTNSIDYQSTEINLFNSIDFNIEETYEFLDVFSSNEENGFFDMNNFDEINSLF